MLKYQHNASTIISIVGCAHKIHLNVRMLGFGESLYVFIPGKNWKLSLAELVTVLRSRKVNFKVTDFSRRFFTVATENILDSKIIDNMGGTIKIGKALSEISSKTVEAAFLHKKKLDIAEIRKRLLSDTVFNKLFEKSLTKPVFGVSVYFESPGFLRFSRKIQRFVGSCFKDGLASQGIKARFMGFSEKRRLPQLTHVEVLKQSLVESGAEVLFCIGRRHTFVSKTLGVHNPFEFQKRDVDKPVQRRIYSIPPRLAAIMVNLSNCLPGSTLFDPFCGVGTILQEALLVGAQVTGMDIDPWCVRASCTNLEWLRKEYCLKDAKYVILQGDSRNLMDKIGEETVDCIVTEPDLGPPLRHLPTDSYAQRIIDKLKPLYCGFLGGAYKALVDGGHLVFVTPCVRTRSGNFNALNLEEELEAVGFKMGRPFAKVNFANDCLRVEDLAMMSSFVDMEKRHKIGREIKILQK
jgi:tRNA G10  N-methylase Trm11